MRTPETHRNAEALGRADRDIRTKFARWGQQHERQRIGRYDRERAGRVEGSNHLPKIPDLARTSGILKERAEHFPRIQVRCGITDDDVPAQRFRTRTHHRDQLRMAITINKECGCLRARHAPGHRHRLGRGSCLIEKRSVCDLESGEVDNHRLEIKQRL